MAQDTELVGNITPVSEPVRGCNNPQQTLGRCPNFGVFVSHWGHVYAFSVVCPDGRTAEGCARRLGTGLEMVTAMNESLNGWAQRNAFVEARDSRATNARDERAVARSRSRRMTTRIGSRETAMIHVLARVRSTSHETIAWAGLLY